MKATEDATRKNITSVIDYSKKTRLEVRVIEDEVKRLSNDMVTLRALFDTQRLQIAALRAQVLNGGRTVQDDSIG